MRLYLSYLSRGLCRIPEYNRKLNPAVRLLRTDQIPNGSADSSTPPLHIDLLKGWPSIFPNEEVGRAMAVVAQKIAESELSITYGSPRGSEALRYELAQFIDRRVKKDSVEVREAGVSAEHTIPHVRMDPNINTIVTSGTSHGLDLCCECFTRPGEAILMESPTFFLAHRIFQARGLIVEDVPAPSQAGKLLDIDAVERRVRMPVGPGSPRVTMLYTIPVNHNPTGATMGAADRERLVDLARRFNFKILADEVYHFLDWRYRLPAAKATQPKPPRFVTFDPAYQSGEDDGGVVLSCSSFSKLLAPGLRVGWVEAAKPLVDQLCEASVLVSGGGPAPIGGETVVQVLKSGDGDAFLDELLTKYTARASALECALERHGLRSFNGLDAMTGGYFAWIALPDDITVTELKPFMDHHGVDALPGDLCDYSGAAGGKSCIRLCIAYLDSAEEISKGVDRLAGAIQDLKKSMTNQEAKNGPR